MDPGKPGDVPEVLQRRGQQLPKHRPGWSSLYYQLRTVRDLEVVEQDGRWDVAGDLETFEGSQFDLPVVVGIGSWEQVVQVDLLEVGSGVEEVQQLGGREVLWRCVAQRQRGEVDHLSPR